MLDVASIREKNGFRFAEVRGTRADHASWFSFDDEQVVRDRHWHTKPGEIVFDIGAAFGSYVLPALAQGARVVAFSPADFDTELLCHNLNLNPELAKRALVVRDGLHAQDGWFDPDHSVFAKKPVYEDGHDAGSWLRVRSLDAFMRDYPAISRVDLMKLDVEGAELDVLRGAEQTIRRYRPRVLVECHNFHRATLEREVWDFMTSLGLGYVGEVHQHCAVSHAFFEVK